MATGFNNTPPASEFRNATSWGRTRQPKNIAGPHGTAVVDFGASAPDPATHSAPSPTAGVYATQNQRYLHLYGKFVKIYIFSYAAGVWKTLVDSSGSVVTCGDAAHTKIVEIAGADLVAFDTDGAGNEFAACSTF